MAKINGWTIGAAALSLLTAGFGVVKGIVDAKETDRKQTEKIENAVQNYMASHSLESGSEV